MGGVVEKATEVVQPALSVFRILGGKINPFVALGIFAVGWLLQDHKNQIFLTFELMTLMKQIKVF